MLESLIAWLLDRFRDLGYPGIVVLMAIESSVLPLPSELVMPPAGYLAAKGEMSFWVAIACGVLGSILGALANSRGHRHEENAARLVNTALEQPLPVGAALLASAEGYTPRANQLLDAAREKLGTIQEIAAALAENLPQPKLQPSRRRRRKRKRKGPAADEQQQQQQQNGAPQEATSENGAAPAPKKRRRRRRKPAAADAD